MKTSRGFPAVAMALLPACIDPLAVNPNTAIDIMRGQGAAAVAADGSRSFRFVVHPSVGKESHRSLLAQWAARPDGCPRGYSVAKTEVVQGMTVYSGPCR